MRDAFAAELTLLAAHDERIVLLMGDIGNHMFDKFKERYPTRFYNCGIAEANMISLAAGLAIRGFIPFVYTFSAFTVGRAFEQIRVDLAFQKLPVIIIGLGAGLTYSSLGATHYFNEDLALMRSLPNMTVVCPADAAETRASVRESLNSKGPVYIRIGKKKEPAVHQNEFNFSFGKAVTLCDGSDICILSAGTIMPNVISAADILKSEGISARVVSFHTLKPLDTKLLEDVFRDYKLVVTVEEHSLIGGFGSAVAEWLADTLINVNAKLLRIGLPDEFLYYAVKQEEARDVYNLSPEKIAAAVKEKLDVLFFD
ncbi:MAG TPA: hypothetical protein O0W90_02990 [Methanocorpusculum sp.]|nr:hypothetical protein [Methanocorpusculum sp.]